MSKHTPGPWKLDATTLEITTSDEVEARIAMIDGDNCDWSQAEADARLIAAAPEMLEALKTAKETIRAWHGPNAWDIYDRVSPEMRLINEAIAKAEGRS